MEIPGAERRWDTMSFYDYVETAQALLVSFALTDGAAQAVSYIMSFASSLIKLRKKCSTNQEGSEVAAAESSAVCR